MITSTCAWRARRDLSEACKIAGSQCFLRRGKCGRKLGTMVDQVLLKRRVDEFSTAAGTSCRKLPDRVGVGFEDAEGFCTHCHR